mmetsp:Transcript_23881/g.71265  ORF Transcript_23881/g.71265 Transcript_23881/m.71265 type:complete len:413 (+) Transcript_23881:136-1374(+)
MASFLTQVEVAPANPIFKLTADYNADEFPDKLNLGVGAYRDASGQPWVLPVVKKAEAVINAKIESGEMNHEYLPIGGLPEFCRLSAELAVGSDSVAIKEDRVLGVQCLSGTGSLRTAGEFIAKFCPAKDVLSSNPTWGNHKAIFERCGLKYSTYRYFNPADKGLDFTGFCEDLKAAPNGASVVLHACAHNPTGVDPTADQWKELAALCKAKAFFIIFDSAYLGFASGDPDQDSAGIRLFIEAGIPLFICQSYSKNFGLYNERTGCLVTVGPDSATTAAVVSQLKILVRANWSNPPAFGARVVAITLGDPALRAEWFAALKTMSGRIMLMREKLKASLGAKGTPGTWDHITKQIGMFSFTGLTADQVEFITKKYHVYMLKNGRANMCGLTEPTVEYFATAIDDAVRNVAGGKL